MSHVDLKVIKTLTLRYIQIREDNMNQELMANKASEAKILASKIKDWLNGLGDDMTSDEERVLLNAIQVLKRFVQKWS